MKCHESSSPESFSFQYSELVLPDGSGGLAGVGGGPAREGNLGRGRLPPFLALAGSI